MSDIKEGDTVVCVDELEGYCLTKGKEYIVKIVDGEFIVLKDDNTNTGGWLKSRFEKKETPENKQQGSKLRKVIACKNVRNPDTRNWEPAEFEAVFHAWGCNYEEFENGPGNYSTAIVERADGSVENVPTHMIKFIKE